MARIETSRALTVVRPVACMAGARPLASFLTLLVADGARGPRAARACHASAVYGRSVQMRRTAGGVDRAL